MFCHMNNEGHVLILSKDIFQNFFNLQKKIFQKYDAVSSWDFCYGYDYRFICCFWHMYQDCNVRFSNPFMWVLLCIDWGGGRLSWRVVHWLFSNWDYSSHSDLTTFPGTYLNILCLFDFCTYQWYILVESRVMLFFVIRPSKSLL